MKWANRHAPKITQLFRKQTLVRTSLLLMVSLFGASMISSLYAPRASAVTQYTVNVSIQYASGKVPSNAKAQLINTAADGRIVNVSISGNTGKAQFTQVLKDPQKTMQACTNAPSNKCANVSLKGSTGSASISFKSGVDPTPPPKPINDNAKHTVYVYTKYDPAKKQTGTDTVTLTGSKTGAAISKTPTITNHVGEATYTGVQSGPLSNVITVCSKDLGGKCQTASLTGSSVTVTLAYDGSSGSSSGKNTPSWYTTATKTNDGGGSDSNTPQCGSDNSSMSWAICPIYNIVATATNSFDNLINKLLHVNTDVFKAGNRYEEPYYTAWSSFRNIALIFIIIAGVVMVIAQATGARAIDAYTIKRVMPRLLFAAIAITLSWIVLIFLINLSNVVGEGVQALIYGPFNSLSTSGGGNGVGGTITGVGELGILSVIGVTAFVLTGGGLLSFIAVAGIAILVGLLVVVLRQILVVFLLIIAPLAIAAYVLPNTQKMAHEWWEWFFRALLMFPLITGFIAIGKVFSLVSLNQSSSNPAFGIVAIIAYVLPYFLLPFTFKMAGSAMGTLAQGVHGFGNKAKSSGMMGQLKEHTKEKNKLGTRFGRGNAFTRRLSDATQAGSRPGEWVKGSPRGWRGNLSTMRDTDIATRGNEAAVKDPLLDRFNGDNDALRAGYNFGDHHSRAKAQEELLSTKYGGKSLDQLTDNERGNLDQDLSRISMLYRNHGEAAQLAFLNKNSQDNNAWVEKQVEVKDANGNTVMTTDEHGNSVPVTRTQTATEQAYENAREYAKGDMNKYIRTAMMIRSNQGRAGRGDVADVNAGTLIPELQKAMASGHFTAENANTVIAKGLATKDAVEQARENPKAIKAKYEAGTARVNQLTNNGQLSMEDIIRADATNKTENATELKSLLDAMREIGTGMASNYASADVKSMSDTGAQIIINNRSANKYYGGDGRHASGASGGLGGDDRVIREDMERQARERAEREQGDR